MSDYTYAFTRWSPRDLTNFAWFCLFFTLSVYVEFAFLTTEDGLSAINPVGGAFLAALLLSKKTMWWGIIASLMFIDITVEIFIGKLQLFTALIFSLSLALQAMVSALLLQNFTNSRPTFDNPKNIFALLLWGCTLTVIIFAIPPAVTSHIILGGHLLHFMWHWIISNAIGVLVMCPLLLSCYTGLFTYIKQLAFIRRIEFLSVLIILFLTTTFVFITDNPQGAALAPYSYLIFPPLIWAAMRFRTHVIFVAAFFLMVVSIYFDYQSGQYTASEHLAFDSIQALQVFLLVVISAVYLLSTLSTERERAAAELQYERGFSESVLNSLPGVVYCYDKSLKFLRWNKNLETVTGYSGTEIAKMSPLDFFDGADRNLIEERIHEVFDKGVSDAEAEFLTKDGKRIPFYFTGLLTDIFDKTCLIGVGIELTQRREAEMKLRASEERLRKIMHGLGPQMLVGLLKTDGTLIEVNRPALEIAGLNADDVLGKPVIDTYWLSHSDEARQQMLAAIDRANQGEPSRFDMQIRAKGDQIATIDFSMQPLRNENGEIEFLLPSANDISERVMLEAKIKESEQQLRLFVEHSPAAIAMFDRDMHYIVASHRWQADFNITDQDVSGLSHYDVFPEIPERWKGIHQRCLNGAIEKCEEDQFPRKNGKIDWSRWEVRPWYTHKGDIGGIIIFTEVITQRKQAELRLKENQMQLMDTQQKLRNLVTRLQEVREEEQTRIAREIHDQLGQCLTGLRIDIKWILDKLSAKNADIIERTHKALILADQTLEAVQKLSLELRPLILDDLGLKSAFEWQAKEFTRRTNCQCNISFELDETVITNKQTTGLFRIMQESLTNVVRHAQASRVDIFLKSDDELLIMDILDNGKGISKEQLSSSNSIGLIGMRERADALGGQVEYLSPQSGGTLVRVITPIQSN